MSNTLSIGAVAGFLDPVHDRQAVFRSLLESLSRPGIMAPLTIQVRATPPLYPATAAVVLCLTDSNTSVWLDESLRGQDIQQFITLNTSAPIVRDLGNADFALIENASAMPPLASFPIGSALCPEKSVTIVIQVRSLIGGDTIALQGPGIETTSDISPTGLPSRFWREWEDNNAQFPRGVDVILTDEHNFLGLPRTVARRRSC
jgi:alpha-D-ribose 1-methylphosphonate 5-triphosphate synthase subunit PhnH